MNIVWRFVELEVLEELYDPQNSRIRKLGSDPKIRDLARS